MFKLRIFYDDNRKEMEKIPCDSIENCKELAQKKVKGILIWKETSYMFYSDHKYHSFEIYKK